jgi:glycosyltransferase involved in cell wall biosynthesis
VRYAPGQVAVRQASVSVVIPAHNAESFIRETLDSVLAQTVQPSEIIVVADCCTDGTTDAVREYAGHVRLLFSDAGSAAAARNAGARAATADWLAFLDADDCWLPEKLERQLQKVGDRDTALVYTDRYNFGNLGDLPEVHGTIQPLFDGDVFVDLLLLGNHITLSSVMVRREVFLELGGFTETLKNAEDWEMWIRVAAGHRIEACPEPLVRYRLHASSKSMNPENMRIARVAVTESALSSERGRGLPAMTRRRIRAATARTNGSDAARRGATQLAWSEYVRSATMWPFDVELYRDVARLMLGR